MKRLHAARGVKRRLNPSETQTTKLSIYVARHVARRAESVAVKVGFSYLTDVVQVLLSLYAKGRVSKKLRDLLRKKVETSRAEWFATPPANKTRLSLRLRNDVSEAARTTAVRANVTGKSELARILLENFASRDLELTLRSGRARSL